ncbi:LysR family transcriptional regulator [Photobacterium sp. 1_MG-2023]|uniref:LysR family transcriptional regulator n=1 Tax=Photobacterium sp. 1_MG-2023 TaxID=3062646 RepID=UPI0026E44C36|nr:LysR family transcriptional regulator [Photobacterium sp. 1_MG-2023]MDO6706928.1 LysR family transcriptional regulator [Photobacterium sp. 1_MG-2023]
MDKSFALLHYFQAVAEYNSFSRAANKLNVSQSTVSAQIKKLESQLGCSLFERENKHHFKLSREGIKLLAECQTSLNGLRHCMLSLSQTETLTGPVNLACSVALAHQLLLPVIDQLMTTYPNLVINLVETSREKAFFEDDLDIALNFSQPDPSFYYQRVADIDKIIAASPDYLARYGTPESLADLTEHRLLIQSQGKMDWPNIYAQQSKFSLPVLSQYFDNNLTKRHATQRSMGLAVLPVYLCTGTQGLVPVLPHLSARLSESLFIMCSRKKARQPGMIELIVEIAELVRESIYASSQAFDSNFAHRTDSASHGVSQQILEN